MPPHTGRALLNGLGAPLGGWQQRGSGLGGAGGRLSWGRPQHRGRAIPVSSNCRSRVSAGGCCPHPGLRPPRSLWLNVAVSHEEAGPRGHQGTEPLSRGRWWPCCRVRPRGRCHPCHGGWLLTSLLRLESKSAARKVRGACPGSGFLFDHKRSHRRPQLQGGFQRRSQRGKVVP